LRSKMREALTDAGSDAYPHNHRLLSRGARAALCRTVPSGDPAAQANRAAFGDSGNAALRSAIRAHAHFAEYVPITTLMVAMLEMAGASALRVHVLMGALVVARLLHPLGMYAAPSTFRFRIGRIGGVTITIALLVTCALSILSRLALGGR
jgi:uncharacterized protein